MQLVNLSNAGKYYTYILTCAPATTLMPVFITLDLHPGQEKSTVNSICLAIPKIFIDISSYEIYHGYDYWDYVQYGRVQLYSVVAHTKSWNLLTEIHY